MADHVYWVRLPGGAAPPDMYRDMPSEVHLAAMENGIRKLRREQNIGFTVSIVDYPFWQPAEVILTQEADEAGRRFRKRLARERKEQ